ncbi:unnamed protein product [Boreogadus saida]
METVGFTNDACVIVEDEGPTCDHESLLYSPNHSELRPQPQPPYFLSLCLVPVPGTRQRAMVEIFFYSHVRVEGDHCQLPTALIPPGLSLDVVTLG